MKQTADKFALVLLVLYLLLQLRRDLQKDEFDYEEYVERMLEPKHFCSMFCFWLTCFFMGMLLQRRNSKKITQLFPYGYTYLNCISENLDID